MTKEIEVKNATSQEALAYVDRLIAEYRLSDVFDAANFILIRSLLAEAWLAGNESGLTFAQNALSKIH